MKPAEFKYYGELIFGPEWYAPMAKAMKRHRDTVYKAANGVGRYKVPKSAKHVIVKLLKKRIIECKKELNMLDRTS